MTKFEKMLEDYRNLPGTIAPEEEIREYNKLMVQLNKEARKENVKVFLIAILCMLMLGLSIAPLVIH